VPIDKAPATPDYGNLSDLGFPVFLPPGKKTSVNPLKGGISGVGPAAGAPGTRPPDYVFYGLIRYRGLISKDHVTGFGITISAIMPLSSSFGGDAYNYHH
jgi:hypothetical protein